MAVREELKEKVAASIVLLKRAERLADALNPQDGFYLGFSGGKDSLVVYELARLAGVKFKAVHNVTGIDAPETIRYIKDNFPEVEFQHAKENYFRLVEKKGLPRIGFRFCCERLKERVGAGNVVLTGVRHEESNKRALYPEVKIYSRRKENQGEKAVKTIEQIMQNEHQCIQGKDRVMVHPILDWTERDVWDFLHEFNLPINPCYQHFGRVGCMFCPFASREQIETYERWYPRYKERVLLAVRRWWEKSETHLLDSPEQYYDWWKTKKSIGKYKAENL